MTDSENIKANFPFPLIPRNPGLPNFNIINEVHSKGKANASSVASELGGGTHGLLGITLSPGTYNQLTGHNFVRPPNPGTVPVNVAGTAAQMAEMVRQHKEELRVYRQVENTELALKSQLIDTFDDTYFRGLRGRHTGFFGITYLQMIAHLYNSYGIITALDIVENEKRMDKPYDPSEAIEIYFDQVEDAVEFAEAGHSPFTTTQIVTKAFIQMFATGLYKDECRDWNKLQVPARTWPVFKAIFLAANKEIREMQALTGNNGYSNNVTQDLFEQTAGALTRIVDANATDREEVANLVINNGITQQQVTAITTTLAALTARLTAIEVNNGNGNNNNNGGGGNNTRRNRGNGGGNTDESYCHTHGRTRRPDHTSATCQHPREGHQLTATLSDRQGGSNRYCGNTA